jgi:hypothetical protein
MNALQKSIAAVGLGAALAFSLPAPVLADGGPYGAPYGHYAGPGHHVHRGPHWREHRPYWKHRHHRHVRTVERVVYEPAPASDPAIVISPNIQLGGGGGGGYDSVGAPSSTLGTVVGAVAGAAVGSQIGKGKGNTAAIAIGSVVGGHIGGRLGAGY